jgi:phosphopantetheinyl transferase (holo-ACP synthase)
MTAAKHVCATTATQSIAVVARNRSALVSRFFSPAEQAALADIPDRTIAGWIAAKKAIGNLYAQERFDPRSFEISRNESGAPFCAAGSTIKIHLSISHTRGRAWGLAAFTQDES